MFDEDSRGVLAWSLGSAAFAVGSVVVTVVVLSAGIPEPGLRFCGLWLCGLVGPVYWLAFEGALGPDVEIAYGVVIGAQVTAAGLAAGPLGCYHNGLASA